MVQNLRFRILEISHWFPRYSLKKMSQLSPSPDVEPRSPRSSRLVTHRAIIPEVHDLENSAAQSSRGYMATENPSWHQRDFWGGFQQAMFDRQRVSLHFMDARMFQESMIVESSLQLSDPGYSSKISRQAYDICSRDLLKSQQLGYLPTLLVPLLGLLKTPNEDSLSGFPMGKIKRSLIFSKSPLNVDIDHYCIPNVSWYVSPQKSYISPPTGRYNLQQILVQSMFMATDRATMSHSYPQYSQVVRS